MASGTVKWFNPEKHYGFIQQDDGGDLFVHSASLTGGMTELTPGQRVGYDIEEAEKGPRAVNVVALNEPPREVPPRPPRQHDRNRSLGGGRRDFKPRRFSKRMFS